MGTWDPWSLMLLLALFGAAGTAPRKDGDLVDQCVALAAHPLAILSVRLLSPGASLSPETQECDEGR